MNYKKLGNTDLDISTICLGTMTWGEQNTQEEGFEQMDYALDQGVNFWDTAELYAVPPREETYGHTEIIIGNWFKQSKKRDKVILASKVAGPMRAYLRGGGNNYGLDKMTEAVNDSKKDYKQIISIFINFTGLKEIQICLVVLGMNTKKMVNGINLKMFLVTLKDL